MMDKHKDFDWIEKYIAGELSEAEKQGFDNRMAEDEELAKEFEKHQGAHKALDFLVAQNLKAQLQEMEEESKVVSLRSRRRARLTIVSVAASVLVLVGAFFVIFPQNKLSHTELAAAYYEVPDFGTRGDTGASPEDTPLIAGLNALQNNAIGEAITQLGEVEVTDPDYLVAQYYLGHAFYADAQYDRAQQSFSIVGNSNDLRYVEEAQWYELLSCLAQNAECEELINGLIGDESHSFHTQAEEIEQRSK
jgi:hypothetical protein